VSNTRKRRAIGLVYSTVAAVTKGNAVIERDGLRGMYPEHRFALDIRLNEGFPRAAAVDGIVRGLLSHGYVLDPSWRQGKLLNGEGHYLVVDGMAFADGRIHVSAGSTR
jgi:hypothetical protein